LPGAVVEEEHVGVVFAPEVFEPADDGQRVEGLPLVGGVLQQVVVYLVEGQRDDGLVVDRLVLFFLGIGHLAPLSDYIRMRGDAEGGIYRGNYIFIYLGRAAEEGR
jgi:hypothetical protein